VIDNIPAMFLPGCVGLKVRIRKLNFLFQYACGALPKHSFSYRKMFDIVREMHTAAARDREVVDSNVNQISLFSVGFDLQDYQGRAFCPGGSSVMPDLSLTVFPFRILGFRDVLAQQEAAARQETDYGPTPRRPKTSLHILHLDSAIVAFLDRARQAMICE
jgi:hypothetical protein